VESADAGVSQHDVAIGLSSNDKDFFGFLMDGHDLFGVWRWQRFVDDEVLRIAPFFRIVKTRICGSCSSTIFSFSLPMLALLAEFPLGLGI
jgi:hypothetical protein